ncbi:MAG: SMC-Scp complex subunit ScpB [Candidatus Pacearchaeota archaeon]|nr:SMC-Scp complex subunit ScpB [Candidatus Pacearchaeota archaeon]
MEDENIKKIEAALFLAARFIDIDSLVRVTGINPLTLKELLERLKETYEKRDSGLIILKKELEGKELWKMDIRPDFAFLINKLASGEAEFTKAEQETLAIIAYKQPIKQSVIVKIRGNKAYEHIRHFLKAELIKAKKVSRTYELSLSEKFYNYFNLSKDKKEVELKEKDAIANS